MTIGAHVSPGLVSTGPVQPVTGRQLLIGVEVEPALTALLLRAAIPRNPERLEAPAGHSNQVLLQRINTERIRDLVIMQRAVGAVRAHHELVARARERGDDAEVIELRIGEIAKDRGRRGGLHRSGVVGLASSARFPLHDTPRRSRRRRNEPDRQPAQRLAARGRRQAKASRTIQSLRVGSLAFTAPPRRGSSPRRRPSSGTDFTIQ